MDYNKNSRMLAKTSSLHQSKWWHGNLFCACVYAHSLNLWQHVPLQLPRRQRDNVRIKLEMWSHLWCDRSSRVGCNTTLLCWLSG